MFHLIRNVQRGEPVRLHEPIDNTLRRLRIALRSCTFAAGWGNVRPGQNIFSRPVGGAAVSEGVPQGLHSFGSIKSHLEGAGAPVTLEVSRINGLVSLEVSDGYELMITDQLLRVLGLDDGLGGSWLDSGAYAGDRPIDLSGVKMLEVHLEQLSTSQNIKDGVPSTHLASVGVGHHEFGDIMTFFSPRPEFKHLRCGQIDQLTLSIRDEEERPVENNDLPIHGNLEIK